MSTWTERWALAVMGFPFLLVLARNHADELLLYLTYLVGTLLWISLAIQPTTRTDTHGE